MTARRPQRSIVIWSAMPAQVRRAILAGGLAAALGGCALDNQGAPSLTGPSELGLSISVTATPDVITQDGQSQAVIAILARDASSQPMRGITFRVETLVDGNQADFGTLSSKVVSTGDSGRAQVTYTAPPAPPPSVNADSTVTISVAPVGTDYGNTVARTVALRLLRPGVITPPSSGLTAVFSFEPTSPKAGDTIVFDASGSTAGLRTITSYQWSFGDGATATGRIASHRFAGAGTFGVTLTVTDDLGRTAQSSKTIALGASNPTSSILFSPADPVVGEPVIFNGRLSVPAPGRTLVSYEWDFGDGGTGSGPTPQHAFNQARAYNVTLTVVDDLGQEQVSSAAVTVKDIQAVFTVSPSDPAAGTTINFNASQSRVAAGASIVAYQWDFGGGAAPTTATTAGPTVSHAYPAAGSYTVVLTITDSQGHSGTASQTVQVQ
jgi:PKD repeat protein